jgi:hypothetical protein
MVEVRTHRGRAEAMAEIRLPHEPGPGVGVGVQGHRFDPRPALRVEFTDGVDEPHRGLSPVDDRDTVEHRNEPPRSTTDEAGILAARGR